MVSGATEHAVPRRPIGRLLIANRGEIAVRIAATARRLGISTVGVYSDADRDAFHLSAVDLACALGGHSPSDSYLRGDAIIAAAQRSGADAVHPGYGFLAENADFAEAVEAAGLIWVGPTPAQIRLLGDKIAAKRTAAEVGVPCTAAVAVGPDGAFDRDELPSVPVVVKAAAGGGGRGMRIVDDLADLDDAIASAQREAGAAFGDDTVFIEPFIAEGHHVEVQIFGDLHGNVVDLGERECSIQRRNQKVIEEAPSPSIDAGTRAALRAGAIALARHVGYVGAGTVEYLVASRSGRDRESGSPLIGFLEVNTRLQVEHPVTEAITDFDLVEWQLAVASGSPLPASQADIDARLARGLHAIEARIVAEDPLAGWLPSTGAIARWRVGAAEVRVDAGVGDGSVVSADYDSLLAKVIASGPTRPVAAGRLAAALRASVVVGVETNTTMLAATLAESDFVAGKTPTSYLGDHPPAPPSDDVIDRLIVAATIASAARQRRNDAVTGFAPSGWRNLATAGQRRVWQAGNRDHHIEWHIEYRHIESWPTGSRSARHESRWEIRLGPAPATAGDGSLAPDERRQYQAVTTVEWDSDDVASVGAEMEGIWGSARVYFDGEQVTASSDLGTVVFSASNRFVDHDLAVVGGGPVSPLPGTVIAVLVSDGDSVCGGDVLMVVEAMKMEHQITAPTDSIVDHVLFAVGDRVDAGDLLVELSSIPSGDQDDQPGVETAADPEPDTLAADTSD